LAGDAIDNFDAREKLFLTINIVSKVRDHLSAIVANGSWRRPS
jgi:hypothetical protein